MRAQNPAETLEALPPCASDSAKHPQVSCVVVLELRSMQATCTSMPPSHCSAPNVINTNKRYLIHDKIGLIWLWHAGHVGQIYLNDLSGSELPGKAKGNLAIVSQAWGLWVGRAMTTVLGERSVYFGSKFTVIQVKIA